MPSYSIELTYSGRLRQPLAIDYNPQKSDKAPYKCQHKAAC
jgi:hypothetical protein